MKNFSLNYRTLYKYPVVIQVFFTPSNHKSILINPHPRPTLPNFLLILRKFLTHVTYTCVVEIELPFVPLPHHPPPNTRIPLRKDTHLLCANTGIPLLDDLFVSTFLFSKPLCPIDWLLTVCIIPEVNRGTFSPELSVERDSLVLDVVPLTLPFLSSTSNSHRVSGHPSL